MADLALQCGLVLLAAGASTRMGRPKQLIEIDGVPLVRRAALAALESPARPVVVVLGANAAEIWPQLRDLSVTVVENPDWADGMGNSLRCGVQTLTMAAPDLAAIIVALADQPHFTAHLIGQLLALQQESGKSIIVTSHCEHRGPPALFLREHFAGLRALGGDMGARDLVQQCADKVATLAVTEESDLDTPEDVERFRAQRKNR